MVNPNTEGNFQKLDRHPEYYIPTADLSILVEHFQFRVHKYFFERESQYFASQLAGPATPGSPLQGSGDGHAIVLDDLTADDFAKFLWVFYNPRYSIYEADVEKWQTILHLANRWSFPEVKDLSVRELEKKEMLDVKRIKLYHDNNVDRNYLIPRYAALCEREEPLSLAEGMDLGMETALGIARAREDVRAGRTASGARSPLTPTIHGLDLHQVVRELFNIAPAGTAGPEAVTTPTVPQAKTPPAPVPTVKSPTQSRPVSPVTHKRNQVKEQTQKDIKKANQGTGPQQQQTNPTPKKEKQLGAETITIKTTTPTKDRVVSNRADGKQGEGIVVDTPTTLPPPPPTKPDPTTTTNNAPLLDLTTDTDLNATTQLQTALGSAGPPSAPFKHTPASAFGDLSALLNSTNPNSIF